MSDTRLSGMVPDKRRALHLAKRQLAVLVWDAVNLEGINLTLPEVQTLLDGVAVGGRRLSDQRVAVNQANAWQRLFALIEDDAFSLEEAVVLELHALAAKEEALTWGVFRNGPVTICGTGYRPPPASELPGLWRKLEADCCAIPGVFERAAEVFLRMARTQFFFDVNKRTGRFMMNGVLLSYGYPPINVPASKQLAFNEGMLDYYSSGDAQGMVAFLLGCVLPEHVSFLTP